MLPPAALCTLHHHYYHHHCLQVAVNTTSTDCHAMLEQMIASTKMRYFMPCC